MKYNSVLINLIFLMMFSGCSKEDHAPAMTSEIFWTIPSLITEGSDLASGSIMSTNSVDQEVTIRSSLSDLVVEPSRITLNDSPSTFEFMFADNEFPEDDREAYLTAINEHGAIIATSEMMMIANNDYLPALTSQLQDWPQTGVFSPATTCEECHRASLKYASPAVLRDSDSIYPDPNSGDISPNSGWQHSVMAHGLSDPYFRANLDHEVHRFPHIAGDIENTCLTCHSPMAHTYAHQTGVSLTYDATCSDLGCYRLESAMNDPLARESISCTLCHQITDTTVTATPTPNSGNFSIQNTTSPEIFGPYTAPLITPMKNRTGYTPTYGSHVQDSAICGVCHELFTPTMDRETNVPNGRFFPEQTPYSEWILSQFGPDGATPKSCQDCHMPEVSENYLTRLAVKPNGTTNTSWPERPNYNQHVFVGGNTWLLESLERFSVNLGLTHVTQPGGFSEKAAITRDFLTRSASLDVLLLDYSDDTLNLDITITNQSGHKLPTGYPSRRVWLALEVFDDNGERLFANGIPDKLGKLSVDADLTREECVQETLSTSSNTCYLNHSNVITDAQTVPIYEMVMGDTLGHITHTLLHADTRLKDNRIPAAGFPITGTSENLAHLMPVGTENDPDFHALASGTDTVHYRLQNIPGAFEVKATLYYQSIRPDFVSAMHGDSTAIDHFRSISAIIPPPAEIINQQRITL